MPQYPVTGVARYCEKCFRKLYAPNPDGGMIVSNHVVMLSRTTFGEHGPLEFLVTEVYCTICFPNGK